MDNWNRNNQNEYTGVSAQRRNRRRHESSNEEQMALRLDPVADDTEEPFTFDKPVIPVEPEQTTEPERPEEPEIPAEPVMPTDAEDTETAEAPERADKPEAANEPAEPAVQAADSRVPAEARRMAAAPYGVPREGAKRPGTRPQVAPRRSPMPEQRRPDSGLRREILPQENTQSLRSGTQRDRAARINVGYAPGRMNEGETRAVPAANDVRESLYGRDAKAYLEKRKQPFRMEEERRPDPDHRQHKWLRVAVALLVLAGLVLSGWMLLKNGFGRKNQINRDVPQILSFDPPKTEGLIAPQDLTFSVQTGKDVEDIQLRADGDRNPKTEIVCADNADKKVWSVKMPVETGFDGTVMLQVRRPGEEEWLDTGYTAEIHVSTPIGVEVTPEGDGEEAGIADPEDEDYYDPDAENTEVPAEVTEQTTQVPAEVQLTAEPETQETAEEAVQTPSVPLTPPPTATPVPTEQPATPTPALVAEAAAEASPDLITQTTVWTGVTKKEKDYSRPAKELIHMPAADEYTKQKLGVLTFRGDNFRRNAAIGTLSGQPMKLSVLWQTEAGSAKGANGVNYYGYEWTGQPVIARWSTEVRTKSNITETKIDKSALKEVIIAGVDGAIRFLDLEDGKITRNSIKLNYPMRGTPTLHPRGYPFLTVGQLTRKMRSRTASKIGLRQYNLYNQSESRIIDGLDGKYHRPLNDIGSFETSALIDRESDTLIVAGTNGMLYLESLGTTFDYTLGVLQISPSVVAMSSRAKGEKSNALVAVESSLAAYDKYVWYADMGGVLRCVDTNTLKPVWAVETGDAVMAAVAMDLTENRELNLYTANMLYNRKKGNGDIQIRRYDALSGKQAWCTDIGVFKSKKDKVKDNVGAKASPVIGQNRLNDYVYFTVTGLSEEGAGNLGLKAETPAALIALNKADGKVAWAYGLESRSESSPIALYDNAGNGWILQCEQNGSIHLLDGLTGSLVNTLQVEGEIEASPAAYNNVVVVGTTGKGKAFVYGIEVKLDKPAESTSTPAPEATEEPELSGEAWDGEKENGDSPEVPDEEYDDYENYEEYDPDAA